ncbi:MAG: TetR/AcrR family transcriptional regulator [Clostridiales bacterium]|nr:TetR/AcrR family transcriptional regulator [Clostridiales bacterium]
MPPKQRFNHKLILDKAYEMFLTGGMDIVNARSVSKALHCSTQPIFSYFPDMSGLRSALVDRAYEDFSVRLAEAEAAEPSILSRCLAYEQFAAAFPQVFLFLTGNDPRNREENACDLLFALPKEVLTAEMDRHHIGEEAALRLQRELCVYAHGTATLLAQGSNEASPEALAEGTKALYTVLVQERDE